MRALPCCAVVAFLFSCSGQSGGTKTVGGDPDDRCGTIQAKLEKLYQAESYDTPEGDDGAALAIELAAANVELVMHDCRVKPVERVECIERATSVAEIERDCIEPLDDEGKVENQRFGRSR